MAVTRKEKRKALFQKLVQKTQAGENSNARKSYEDDRFWQPVRDKSGNGGAVIRFLPSPNENEDPYVSYFDHAFQGPSGSWYIEKSLTSIGKNDPVSDYNSSLWNSGVDKNKDIARRQKRNLRFVSNIYVEKDPINPENEGKVFLFRFGKQHWDKIEKLMHPVVDELEDEVPEPIVPFDPWDGASYKLKITTRKGGYPNYEESSFLKPAPLFKGKDADEKIEEVISQGYELYEFIDPANYKTYDELQAKLNRVLGTTEVKSPLKEASDNADDEFDVRTRDSDETLENDNDESPFIDDEDDDDIDFDEMLKKFSS